VSGRSILLPLAMLPVLLLLLPAPAPAQDSNSVAAQQEVRIQQLEGQMRDMNGQIEQLNYRVQQLSDRLDKLVADVDFRLRQLEGTGGGPPPPQGQNAPQGQNQGQAEPPPQPMTPLTGDQPPPQSGGDATAAPSGQPKALGTMSQSQYDAQAKLLNQNADPAAAAKAAAGAAPPKQQSAGNQTAAASEGYALPGSTPDEQYQYAFDLLRQTKYDEAEKALHTFVDEYPENPLAGNASYWLGETYFVRQDYNNAALTFAQSFQKYPKSPKAPDTLLKLGMSLAALGETSDACKALRELSHRFPTASDTIKQRAAKEASKNGCH